jgi:hypothetical protein
MAHRQQPRSRTRRAIATVASAIAVVALVAVLVASRAPGYHSGPGATPPAPGRPALTSDPANASGGSRSAGPSTVSGGASSGTSPGDAGSPFQGGLLIADRGNGRMLIVTNSARIVWSFPGPESLPKGQQFSADDAFIAPDHRTIVANDEAHPVIDRIDIATRRVIWQYGTYQRPGSRPGFLNTPDDAYPLANGDVVTADIRNCRILQISPAKKIVRQWGRTGVCRHDPPRTYDLPNGDTPLADGGLLITEIRGSRVVRLDARGRVVFDIHVPASYPSDAQLDSSGSVLVVDYASPGAILRVSRTGKVLWLYRPGGGRGRLDHPSLAVALANGDIALNDDGRDRVLVVDPARRKVVWQYGRADRHSRSPGFLSDPDGIDLIPATVLAALPAR